MATAQTFRGKVNGGTLPGLSAALAAFEGREVEARLGPPRKARSLSQNDWYWAAIVPELADEWGYEVDDKSEIEKAHESLKFQFLRVTDENGRERVRSTTELSTKEFSEYCERCRRYAAIEYGRNIPDPGRME